MVNIENLNYNEKIGQLFLIGIDGTEITDKVRKMIEDYKIGGVILYSRNYKTYKDMLRMINNLKEINRKNKIPLFIAIDQEGGRVNRMPDEFKNIKSPKKIVTKKNIDLVRDSIDVTSKMLMESGVNMNIAPVLDIQRFKDNHPIGDRCYGKNKRDVCLYGVEAMKQMQKNGLISVIKHFPGHGATRKDSHYGLPRIARKIERIENDDIAPFKKAVEEGADCVMVGHLIVRDVDKFFPVSLSKKIISKYLRERLKYDGVVITDDIKMQAISLFYGAKFATMRALSVGNDIVMMRLGYKKEMKIINNIIKSRHKISEEEIDNKVKRILKLKAKYNVNDNEVYGCDIDEVNKTIMNLNDIIEDKQ
ncbi:MAG: beta-N-acetylhexosaminidase [Clostridia bacterium]|nr:beta-N-acetylhexosaminidase [Clostridia bacterium]